jgi:DNA-binding NarL/FixJ family response regulator
MSDQGDATPGGELWRTPRRQRVLVVDDHPFFREGLISWINRDPGFECCGWAECTTTALQAIETHKPDLLLLDVQLRGSDGFDVLAALATRSDAPPTIVLSQHESADYAERAARAGARGYVTKTEASSTVLEAIRAVLAGGLFFRSRIIAAANPAADFAPKPNPLRTLADREREVLRLLGAGRSTKAIAEELGISVKTVEWYRTQLKVKLGIADGALLIRQATLWHHEGSI